MVSQSNENDAPECTCESMAGRFGAHRSECPWQIAFEEQLAREIRDIPPERGQS